MLSSGYPTSALYVWNHEMKMYAWNEAELKAHEHTDHRAVSSNLQTYFKFQDTFSSLSVFSAFQKPAKTTFHEAPSLKVTSDYILQKRFFVDVIS